jgi:glycosyltransferase involved in cell wall biosynthesis
MNTPIQSHLQIIRKMEQRRLLDKLSDLIRDNKEIPAEHWQYFSYLIKGNNDIRNIGTSLGNYQKLYTLALFMSRKQKRIGNKLQSIIESLEELRNNDAKQETGNKSVDKVLETVNGIQGELGEMGLRMKTVIPEQPDLKPLRPFLFLEKNGDSAKGMVSIIVSNENGAAHLEKLFDSFIRHNTWENYRFIISDKNSKDESLAVIKTYQDKIKLEVINYEHFVTNSYLYDLAVDGCVSEYLLFLHSKAVLQSDIVPAFIDILKKERSCGIAGASLFATGNSKEVYGGFKFTIDELPGTPDIPFPVMDPKFLAESGFDLSTREFRNKDVVFIPHNAGLTCLKPVTLLSQGDKGITEVPAVSSSALFCRRSDFIQAGGFDLNYHNGNGDVDLCITLANKLKKKILLSNDIRIGIDSENILAEIGSSDELSAVYNLGTLVNKHGCQVKENYLSDLIFKRDHWTSDEVFSLKKSKRLVQSLQPVIQADLSKPENKQAVDKVVLSYLDGARDRKLRFAIKIPAFNNENLEFWGDYHFANSLKNAILRKGYPCHIDTFESWYENGYLTDDVVIHLRGMKEYHTRGSQINIIWNISHPEHIGPDEYESFDHVFVASQVYAEKLAKSGIVAECLQQCTDPELFFPGQPGLDEGHKPDVLFVGNSRGVMRKSVQFCLEKDIPLSVYGTGWENLLPPEKISGNFIRNEELGKYYAGCTVLLNDHWEDMAAAGFISNRLFDALACGATVLTDPVPGLDETFGEGLFIFHNAEELEEKVRWIKDHPEEAKRHAEKNEKLVLKHHTFDHRAEKIIETALKIHRRKTHTENGNLLMESKLVRRLYQYMRTKIKKKDKK